MKKGKPMKKTALLLAVLLPFCAAHAAGGKAQSREQARRKADEKAMLDRYAKTHTLEREKDVIRQYQQRNDPESREIAAAEEKLAPEQEIVVRTRFTAGKTYNITGRCDPECDNMYLDLYRNVYLDLYDEETRHGLRVKNDLRVLKSPSMSWTAEKDEDYTAVLTMKKCTKKTCAAALQIFEGSKAFW